MYSIEIWRGGKKLAEARGENEAALLYRGAYEAGDEIRFSSDSQHAVVQVDQQVKPGRVQPVLQLLEKTELRWLWP